MGLYLNPDNQEFFDFIKADVYVDKTGLIRYTNGQIGKGKRFIASSRPRRFGKSLAVQMLTAYYSKGCNSKELFQGLEIARDSSFETHLNKYDLILLDIQWMRGIALKRMEEGKAQSVIGYIQREVVKELHEAYPECVSEDETLLAAALAKVNEKLKLQFVIVIDEWDCVFREDRTNVGLQTEYIAFLKSLFKGRPAEKYVRLAYITGILPIKKYGTQSALNNFRELTMVTPNGIAEYVGFTEAEVSRLCEEHHMPFSEMKKWYDGYYLDKAGHVYCPNSVMEALAMEEFQNYWSKTETYEALKVYIEMDFDGLKQKIVDMLGGARCKVEVDGFQNDMTTFQSADDVLTLLIHLGYLGYDREKREVFIPNEEVRSTFVQSVRTENWSEVYKAINQQGSRM